MSDRVTSWAREDLAALESRGLLRSLEPLTSRTGAEVVVNGEERLINFSSNDYLGLSTDPQLVAQLKAAFEEHLAGAGASRLITGDSPAHRSLEKTAARFEGTEAALVFNSGYAANVGTLSALVGEGDTVFSDALNHASIVDGCRLSKAKVVVYPHRDAGALEALLASTPGRRQLVVTDTVFSMDGDLAPLKQLSQVCETAQAALMVDEAHATGVLGATGAGLCEREGVQADLRMATLSKAVGCVGAYVASSAPVRELLFNRARSLVFSTALPPGLCAAAAYALGRVQRDSALRERLWANIGHFASGLERLGLPAHRDSAIFSVVLGAPEKAVAASKQLRAAGLLVKAIRPPTVPAGTSRLRFALSAAHSLEHLDRALNALHDLKELNR
ncbi:MAG: 8-amino-7-oxononanoate synthase [Myxococcaceae bacterium]